MEKEKGGYVNILVSRKKVEWIAHRHTISQHAKTQMIRRDSFTEFALRGRILNSPLAWKTFNGCIAIALDLHNYIVVDPTTEVAGEITPTVVTFVNLALYDENVVDKMLVTYKEFCQQDASK